MNHVVTFFHGTEGVVIMQSLTSTTTRNLQMTCTIN
jgi:hypothetical protein